MAFGNTYVFGFATAICVVCSLAVSSVSMGLRDKQKLNKERDLKSNILGALGLPEDGSKLDGPTIDKLWDEAVQPVFINPEGKVITDGSADQDGDGDVDQKDVDAARKATPLGETPPVLSVYLRKEGDKTISKAIALNGKGLWGPISGYLALDGSGTTVSGATFFAPKETPGLGAEIVEKPFKEQWIGKKIKGAGGKLVPIDVVKGAAAQLCPDRLEQCVDGVSGATITSRGVDVMIEEAIEAYKPYLRK